MTAFHRSHVSHGNHPMGVVAFVLVLAGFLSLAVSLTMLATGETTAGIVWAVVMVAAFAGGAAVLIALSRQMYHSAFFPVNTEHDRAEYDHMYHQH